MAAVVFGGSPRHHSSNHSGHRSANTNSFKTIAGRLAQSSPSLQYTKPTQPSVHMNPASNTIFPPPTSFISSATPIASVVTSGNMHLQYQQQQHQAQYQQHHSGMHHQSQPQPNMSHQQQQQHHFRHSKRKTAVEMLAESKQFYVKSEMVLDRQQQLSYSGRAVASGQQQSPSCKNKAYCFRIFIIKYCFINRFNVSITYTNCRSSEYDLWLNSTIFNLKCRFPKSTKWWRCFIVVRLASNQIAKSSEYVN